MARSSVVLTLLLMAFIGLASAQAPAYSPIATPSTTSTSVAVSPAAVDVAYSPDTAASSPDTIGAIGDDVIAPSGDAVEAPIGGPVSSIAFGPVDAGSTAEPPVDSSSNMVKFSAAGLTLAVAGYFF